MKAILPYLHEHYHIDRLADITWAHATNNQERFQQALQDPQIMVLEADVMLSAHGDIIMAHPPASDSDLHFDAFLQGVSRSKQAIKLDFKNPEVLIPCLQALQHSSLTQPVLLNADIAWGDHAPKFNGPGFIAVCKNLYPQGILSPDWANSGVPYTQANIDDMLDLCRDNEQVTFPVEARLLPSSWTLLPQLLQRDQYSLTIWCGVPITSELLLWLQEHTDPSRVSYDCFDEQGHRLRWW
jgi:hypothetical protein